MIREFEERFVQCNLIAKRGEGYDWVSRDYAGCNPPCRVSYCPCNKNGKCELPAQIDIRADGRCQKSIDFQPK